MQFLSALPLGHAVLLQPAPRASSFMRGDLPIKLKPFEEAASTANAGCGGALNQEASPGQISAVYAPGSDVDVTWSIKIKHPTAYTNTGVRIAMHYGMEDSFAENVLAGGVGAGRIGTPLSAAPVNRTSNVGSATVRLPENKTCARCVLQFIWAAAPGTDGPQGGYYISCADVSIIPMGAAPLPGPLDQEWLPSPPPSQPALAHHTSPRYEHLKISIIGSLSVFIVLSCFARWARRRWPEDEGADGLRREQEAQMDMRELDEAITGLALTPCGKPHGSTTTR